MSSNRPTEKLVEDARLDEIAKTIRRRKPRCVILGGSPTAHDLLRAIEELKRHRKLEELYYWGDEDD